jgi:hypothetical protein
MLKEGTKIAFATVAMGISASVVLSFVSFSSLPGRNLMMVFIPILAGAGVYFIAAKLFKCESLEWITSRKRKA